MGQSPHVERRRQFCALCGQVIFDYYRSPDGHFGLVDRAEDGASGGARSYGEVRCTTCGARYRLLDRLSPMGQPVVRA